MLEGLDLKNLLDGVRARASIIFYLNKMVDEGVLGFRDATGKGGHHRMRARTGDDELKMSRASVIFFLDDMVEEGVLEYETETGKGGHHRVYFPAMKPAQF